MSLTANSEALQNSPGEFLQALLEKHSLVLISTTYCTFCTKLKALLVECKIQFTAVEINVIQNGRKLFEEVVHRSQCHTVPQVFWDGTYVGGYDEILTMYHRGELKRLMQG